MLARGFALRPTVVNRWDFVAVPLIFGALVLTVYGLRGMDVPLGAVERPAISLDRAELPLYALYTTLRMFAAMLASLVFTFTYGALAAKSRRAEMILVPVLDILQSVPILGFLSFTVVVLLSRFTGRARGAQWAAGSKNFCAAGAARRRDRIVDVSYGRPLRRACRISAQRSSSAQRCSAAWPMRTMVTWLGANERM